MPMEFINALLRGLVSLWIVGAGLSAHALQALSGSLSAALPSAVATAGGALAMLCVFPALLIVVLGIVGLPTTWLETLQTFCRASRGNNVVAKLMHLTAQVFQILFFRPFPCPPTLDFLPDSIKQFAFRDPEQLIPPPEAQLRHAVVRDECWVFVNGVATTSALAQSDAHDLFTLFGRPIWTCFNPTDSIWIDLLECIVDKIGFFAWFWETQPARKLAQCLRQALAKAEQGQYKRVVLIAHSQGTIITSVALRDIVQGDRRVKEQSRKFLEVYCFANCAHQMPVKDAYGVQVVNYLENISNDLDSVAWLGVLFPWKSFWWDICGRGISVEGNTVTESGQVGHFLSTHYLAPFSRGMYPSSRLQAYRNGRKPVAAIEYKQK